MADARLDFKKLDSDLTQMRNGLLFPVLFVVGLSIAVICGLVAYAADSQNKIAKDKSVHMASSIVNTLEKDLGRLSYDFTYWDEAVENLIVSFNPVWARDNVGPYLADTFQVHSSFVLNENNQIVYSMIDGEEKPGDPFQTYKKDIALLIEQTRARTPKGGLPVPVTGFTSNGTQMFLVAASSLTNYTYNGDKINLLPTKAVLVILQALSPEKLAELSENYLLNNLQLDFNSHQLNASTASYGLTTLSGETMARLTWNADQPGSEMLKWLLPVILVLFVIILSIFTLFWRRANAVAQTISLEIRNRHKAEKKLVQAQKMQALGNLVGGISHNLNNLMQPILALSMRLQESLPAGTTDQNNARTIGQASQRAAELVRQLMMFSRQEVLEKEFIDIHRLVVETLEILKPTIPATALLKSDLDEDAGFVLADASQIQSVLINLVSNAIDALENAVGEISVGLCLQHPNQDMAPNIAKRSHETGVILRVSDTGTGMDEETQRLVFDPFF
ncbi:MAG: hypothetical protein HQ483_16785, partial [Rhodospirillales bacterium]|nr:hypothetical protein [Rhodospirillales bacterium]